MKLKNRISLSKISNNIKNEFSILSKRSKFGLNIKYNAYIMQISKKYSTNEGINNEDELKIEDYLRSKNNGKFPFVIKSEIAKEAQKIISTKEEKEDERGFVYNQKFMQSLINIGTKFAKPPISNFYVSCIGQSTSNNLLFGVNLEFPPIPLYSCVHAEQSLISSLITNRELSLKKIYLSHAPCGHCRQFINEILNADKINIFILTKNQTFPFFNLLPQSFGPTDLGISKTMFQIEKSATQNARYEKTHSNNQSYDEKLFEIAKQEIDYSHSPYTNCKSTVVLKSKNGTIAKGVYLESAAYNPSLPPLQSALINLNSFEIPFSDVEEVFFAREPSKGSDSTFITNSNH